MPETTIKDAFDARDKLADRLALELEADGRVTFAAGTSESVFHDLAEALILSGWVTATPEGTTP